MKKISVIISVYNCEEFLDECLDSLVRQTMPKEDFEVIIINDGSKDNSLKIIKKFLKKNAWVLIDRENKGLSASRNEGLDIATGEYVTFFDSDDILETDALENMYNEITNNNCDIGLFRTTNFNSTKTFDDNYIDKFSKLPKVTTLDETPLLATFIRSVAILYKRKIIKNIRFIPKVIHEDNYFCIKGYNASKKIYTSSTYVYKIRKREGENLSITQKLNFSTYKDMVTNILTADLEIKKSYLIKIHANQLLSYIENYVSKSHYLEALLLLNDYLFVMKNNKVINNIQYLKIKVYIYLKSLFKINKSLYAKKLKNFFLSSLTIISPTLNTKVFYKRRIGKKINLENPQTFNEKIQWLKLNEFYPNELVTKCADKVSVRDYIKEIGCEEILIDVIKIYDNEKQINFDELPNKFVLKWNFGCGYNIICNDKNKLNENVTRKLLKIWGKSKFHLYNSELHYKKIKRKIICEKFIESENSLLPNDYKFYCFNGKAEYVMICSDRDKGDTKFYFFDRNWNLAKLNKRSQNLPEDFTIEKPEMMDKMFEYADKLSQNFSVVRVDLYTTGKKIFFGELTFTPSAGLDTGYTSDGDKTLADKIIIKDVKK